MNNSHANKRRPVAPFNPDSRRPGEYLHALEELGDVKACRQFFAHWVRQFFKRFLKHHRRDLGCTGITTFREHADFEKTTSAMICKRIITVEIAEDSERKLWVLRG